MARSGGTLQVRSEAERLVAEQAVLLHRQVLEAMNAAPHGCGLEVTEAAVMQGGMAFLQRLLQHSLSAQPEAQKGGSARGPARAARRPRSKGTRRRR
jgi:hypothetical protein